MVIDEVGFCKGIHSAIKGYICLWLSYYGTVLIGPFYSCVPACCRYLDLAMLRIWFVEHPVYTMFTLSHRKTTYELAKKTKEHLQWPMENESYERN